MLLTIDIGNTNTNYGVFDGNNLIYTFSTTNKKTHSLKDDIIKKLNSFNNVMIDGAIISSVVPKLDEIIFNFCNDYLKIKPLIVSPLLKTGLKFKLKNKEELGADLIAGASYCVYNNKKGSIVIDIGTAMTVSVINEESEFLGGMIFPGIKTSFSSLFKKAAKLDKVELNKPKFIVGNDTTSCIQSGMVYGYSLMIDGIIRKIKENNPSYKVYLTGGDGMLIKDYLEEEVFYDENLLLKGLKIIYDLNK